MDAGIRSTKTENTQGIRKFHRISAPEAISGEIPSKMQALVHPAIKIFHWYPTLEGISSEISSKSHLQSYYTCCMALFFYMAWTKCRNCIKLILQTRIEMMTI